MNIEISWLDGLGIGIISFWIFVLIKKYVSVFYVSRPKNWMKDVLIFILIFGARFLFFVTEHNILPLLGILLILVPNALFIYLLGKGTKMLILAGATFFSAVEISMDVLVFFGLNLILPEQYIIDVYFFLFVILVYPLAYLLLGVASKHDEERLITNRKKLQLIMLFGIILVRIVANIFIMYAPEILWSREISNDVFIALMIMLLVTVLGENEVSTMSYQKQIKDIEYNALKRHMEDIEQQTLELQKFKHDYRNILMSLEWHILKSENPDLIQYFNTRIKQISQSWDEEDSVLKNIDRINEKEVRSILRMKIQRMLSLNMKVEIEQIDEINTINIDPLVMVRAMGIILDNAIEEVEHLKNGVIKIGFTKEEKGIVFYVSNSCRENHCSLEDITKKAFTTKGEGRGIGLQILSDFSLEYTNFFVETKIVDNWFTQVVTITG